MINETTEELDGILHWPEEPIEPPKENTWDDNPLNPTERVSSNHYQGDGYTTRRLPGESK